MSHRKFQQRFLAGVEEREEWLVDEVEAVWEWLAPTPSNQYAEDFQRHSPGSKRSGAAHSG